MSPPQKGQAAGCHVTKEDTPIVIGSITCAFAYCIYGACYSALSAALPQLSDALGMSDSDFGFAYSTRGVGYLIGTLISAYVLNMKNLTISKPFLTCVSLLISGVTMVFIGIAKNFAAILVLFFIQGVGFGGVDMMANCAVPEMWGLRAQPWMQAMHTGFGVAAIVGPVLVGALEYETSFLIIAAMSLMPMGLLFVGYLFAPQKSKFSSISSAGSTRDSLLVNTLLNSSHMEDGVMNPAGGGGLSRHVPANPDNHTRSQNFNSYKNNTLSHSHRSRSHRIENSVISNGPLSLRLAFTAAPELDDDEEEAPIFLIPSSIKWLTCVFYFTYMGYAAGFASWISTYAIDVGVTSSNSEAAYLVSIYWACMTSGRLLAIFVAMKVSATKMMRAKLIQCVIAAVILLLIADRSYTDLCIATGVVGFAVSSIFPLAMTVVTDYGFTMDANATTLFMIGTTVGDSILPVLVGFIIQLLGDDFFLYTMALCSFFLCLLYFIVNWEGHNKKYFEADRAFVDEPTVSPRSREENQSNNTVYDAPVDETEGRFESAEKTVNPMVNVISGRE